MLKYQVLALLILTVSLFAGIDSIPFRGEEARRFIMSMEMYFSGDYFNPTVLGEKYFNKPPFFGWVVSLSFLLFGYTEFALRIVSVLSTIFSMLIAGYITYMATKNIITSLMASIIFISFIDVLFWYGFLGEIDMFFTLLVNVSLILFFKSVTSQKPIYALVAGLFGGIAFLTKGFPVLVFAGLFIVVFLGFYTEHTKKIVVSFLISCVSLLLVLTLWILNLEQPDFYLSSLIRESFSRVSTTSNLFSFLIQKLKFLLIIFKMTLPFSLLILYIFITKKFKPSFYVENRNLVVFYIWSILVIVIFLVFTNSAGRYVLPVFPVIASFFAIIIVSNKPNWVNKVVSIALLIGVIRIVAGILYPEYYIKHKGDLKSYAYEIKAIVDSYTVSCDCHSKYEVCAYLDISFKRPVYSSTIDYSSKYTVSCEKKEELNLVKTYKLGKDEFYLYAR